MKKSKISETQIFSMLNEAQAGVPVNDLCRKYKVANSTYYKLKAKYAGMSLSDLKKLKALEAENAHLKAMYADISLEHKILREVMEKKFPELSFFGQWHSQPLFLRTSPAQRPNITSLPRSRYK